MTRAEEREKEEKGRERKRSNPKRPEEIKLGIRNNKEGRNGGEGWQRERERRRDGAGKKEM